VSWFSLNWRVRARALRTSRRRGANQRARAVRRGQGVLDAHLLGEGNLQLANLGRAALGAVVAEEVLAVEDPQDFFLLLFADLQPAGNMPGREDGILPSWASCSRSTGGNARYPSQFISRSTVLTAAP